MTRLHVAGHVEAVAGTGHVEVGQQNRETARRIVDEDRRFVARPGEHDIEVMELEIIRQGLANEIVVFHQKHAHSQTLTEPQG